MLDSVDGVRTGRSAGADLRVRFHCSESGEFFGDAIGLRLNEHDTGMIEACLVVSVWGYRAAGWKYLRVYHPNEA